MGLRRVARLCVVVVASVVASAVVVAGCGSSTSSQTARPEDDTVPPNVTVQESDVMPPHLPPDLVATSGRLAELVDFHEADFSGSWFDPADGSLHVGVATPAGRALLDKRGLTHDPDVVVEVADRSLAEGQRFVEGYVSRSALADSIVGWGTLPQGDGFDLFVHAHRLTSAQLAELGALPVRVVVTLGQDFGSLD